MEANSPPLWNTSLTSIVVFQADGEGASPHEFGQRVLGPIANRYGLEPLQPDHSAVTVSLDGFQCHVKSIETKTGNILIVTVSRSSDHFEGWRGELSHYQGRIRSLLQFLPSDPSAIFSVFKVSASDLKEALTILQQYSAHVAERPMGVGIIWGCLLAVFDDRHQGDSGQVVERDLLLSPLSLASQETEATTSELLEGIAFLASIQGEVHRLHRMRQPFFAQIGSTEEDARKAIGQVLLRRYGGTVKLEDLETSLEEITTRFSTMSVLAGTVRRDCITVEDRLDAVEGLLRRWNESEVEGYPTIFSTEMARCSALSKPFKGFLDRTEVLRGELGTVLDTVRTYLSVEQQKLTADAQRSSKDLLARLVRLQEVLHKLEILIVAFYITEMGRLAFEAVAHETATLLTVGFIPVALLIAVGIRRLLHGPPQA